MLNLKKRYNGSRRSIILHSAHTYLSNNMATPDVTFPSLLWRRRQDELNNNASDPVELARSPTWPARLPSPRNIPSIACNQPNLYLQLSQILEWEIWHHNQTRSQMYLEQTRCKETEAEVWRLSQIISQWEDTCRTVHAALDEHRMSISNWRKSWK